jgi:hypothetical protein
LSVDGSIDAGFVTFVRCRCCVFDLHVDADCADHVYSTEAVKQLVPERAEFGRRGERAYPNVREAGTAKRGRFLRLLSAEMLVQLYTQIWKNAMRGVLMPNRPVKTRAANSRTKPTVNCWSLEMVGAKGWLAEASQSCWRGVEDIESM